MPPRVLVVDDNPGHRAALRCILEALGMEVRAAVDGRDGVEAFKHDGFDLVLMDVTMPRLNGLAATREIRLFERERDLRPTVLYMVTSHDEEADCEASLTAGADGHIAKPVDVEGLVFAVAHATGQIWPRTQAANAAANDPDEARL